MTADAPAVRRRPKDRKQQILVQARELPLSGAGKILKRTLRAQHQ